MNRFPPTTPAPTAQIEKAVHTGATHGMLQHAEEIMQLLVWLHGQEITLRGVLEIGQHQGGLTRVFCEMTDVQGLVVGLDKIEGVGGGLSDVAVADRNQALSAQYPQYLGLVGDSQELRTVLQVRRHIPAGSLDLLFIDGDHTYDGVVNDYFNYRHLVRPGGVVCVHDLLDTVHTQAYDSGVHKFWAELHTIAPSGSTHTFIAPDTDWGGIGLLQVGVG